jgi:hypothetical protein
VLSLLKVLTCAAPENHPWRAEKVPGLLRGDIEAVGWNVPAGNEALLLARAGKASSEAEDGFRRQLGRRSANRLPPIRKAKQWYLQTRPEIVLIIYF